MLTDSYRILLQLQKSLDPKGICPHHSTIKFFEYRESESSCLSKMNRIRSPNLREEQHPALVSDFIVIQRTSEKIHPLSPALQLNGFHNTPVFGLISLFEILHQSSERLENASLGAAEYS